MYRGADGDFTLYDDDGASQDYLSGRGTSTRMTWDDRAGRLTVEPGAPAGMTDVPTRRTFDVVLVPGGTRRTVMYPATRTVIDF